QGMNVILEIEVCGAMQIKKKCPDAVTIFITPPSYSELCRRLEERATESSEDIRKRLEIALTEIKAAKDYDYIIINRANESSKAADDIIAIYEGKYKKNDEPDFINKFINDFTKQ
ncbi:MAG TPA: guanylate kinase, partial [Clostridiales bacterium]|nr:guanylate kinase [Clostridiales bacterium]